MCWVSDYGLGFTVILSGSDDQEVNDAKDNCKDNQSNQCKNQDEQGLVCGPK